MMSEVKQIFLRIPLPLWRRFLVWKEKQGFSTSAEGVRAAMIKAVEGIPEVKEEAKAE